MVWFHQEPDDGRFWIALIEKTKEDGALSVGRCVFGAETTNNDLLHFYPHLARRVPTLPDGTSEKLKKAVSIKGQERLTNKSRVEFKKLLKERLGKASRGSRVEAREAKAGRSLKKTAKKKEKKRGH